MFRLDEARRDNRADDAVDATAGTLLVLNKGPSPAPKKGYHVDSLCFVDTRNGMPLDPLL